MSKRLRMVRPGAQTKPIIRSRSVDDKLESSTVKSTTFPFPDFEVSEDHSRLSTNSSPNLRKDFDRDDSICSKP